MQRTQSGPPANVANSDVAPRQREKSRRIEEKRKAAAAAATFNQPAATGGTAQTAAKQEIQRVQSAIERCLHRYMPQKDVVSTLQTQAQIPPAFTNMLWKKLEEQNADFFQAYHLRLRLKDQIIMFNSLVEKQMAMMQKLHTTWLQAMPALMGMGPNPGMMMSGSPMPGSGPAMMNGFGMGPGMMPFSGMPPGSGMPGGPGGLMMPGTSSGTPAGGGGGTAAPAGTAGAQGGSSSSQQAGNGGSAAAGAGPVGRQNSLKAAGGCHVAAVGGASASGAAGVGVVGNSGDAHLPLNPLDPEQLLLGMEDLLGPTAGGQLGADAFSAGVGQGVGGSSLTARAGPHLGRAGSLPVTGSHHSPVVGGSSGAGGLGGSSKGRHGDHEHDLVAGFTPLGTLAGSHGQGVHGSHDDLLHTFGAALATPEGGAEGMSGQGHADPLMEGLAGGSTGVLGGGPRLSDLNGLGDTMGDAGAMRKAFSLTDIPGVHWYSTPGALGTDTDHDTHDPAAPAPVGAQPGSSSPAAGAAGAPSASASAGATAAMKQEPGTAAGLPGALAEGGAGAGAAGASSTAVATRISSTQAAVKAEVPAGIAGAGNAGSRGTQAAAAPLHETDILMATTLSDGPAMDGAMLTSSMLDTAMADLGVSGDHAVDPMTRPISMSDIHGDVDHMMEFMR